VPHLPRFRALALFRRRPPERVERSSLPASETCTKADICRAWGAADPSIAVSDDDRLAFRTYNRRLATQVSDEPRLAHRACREIVRRCFDDGPRLAGRRAHED